MILHISIYSCWLHLRRIKGKDFKWAPGQIDGMIDISAEDLADLYEFAAEYAQSRNLERVNTS